MYFWLLSVLITIISDKVSTALLESKLKKMGYIYKKVQSKFNLETIISWILILTPYLNLILLATILGSTIKLLVDEKFLFKWTRDSIHSAKDVKGVYESRAIKKDVLRDAMILDGADEKIIAEEMAKGDTLLKGIIEKDDLISLICNIPEYTEKEYEWACAQYNAEQLLEEIELNTSLDDEQKAQLLKLFKASFLDESKGKENKTNVMKKALKIAEQKSI